MFEYNENWFREILYSKFYFLVRKLKELLFTAI